MRRLIVTMLVFSGTAPLLAQDIHFSQYYMPNLWINPAMTGFTPYPFRLVLGYRNQWQSVTPYPYRTFYGSIDVPVFRNRLDPNILGVGLVVVDDRAGHSQLGTTQIMGSVAYNHWLGAGFIGVGLQAGWGNRSFKTDRLTFGSQFTYEGFDPTLPSGEAFYQVSSSFLDIAAGVWGVWTGAEGIQLYGGLSAYHLNNPTTRFMNQRILLYMRFTAYAGGSVDLDRDDVITFAVLGQLQGGYREISVGGGWVHYFRSSKWTSGYMGRGNTSIMLGAWYRIGDAIYPAIRLDTRVASFGVSYDINISSLRRASGYRGGIELFVAFYGFEVSRFKARSIECPRLIGY